MRANPVIECSFRAAATLLLLASAACAGGEDATQPPPADNAKTPGFSLVEKSDTAIAGELRTDAIAIHFQAARDGNRLVSVVVVGDQTFEWVRDEAAGNLGVDGKGAVLTEGSLAALRTLRDTLTGALDKEATAKGSLAIHKKLLAAHVSWLASGHEGNSVGTFTAALPAPGGAGGEVAYGGFGDDGVTCLRKGPWTQFYAESDSGWWVTGTFPVDATVSCANSFSGCASGWDGSCMGQCGGGCQPWWKNGSFQDCFDHDFCTYYFGGSNCNNQFWDAADDYAASVLDLCN
jgi:hypothetical protein